MKNPEINESIKILNEIGKIQINSFKSRNLKELSFIIVNDTQKVFSYHLAVLFEHFKGQFKIVNVSGQAEFSKTGGFADKLTTIANSIPNPANGQRLNKDSFEKNQALFEEYQLQNKGNFYWQPIKNDKGELLYGLWLENWGEDNWNEGRISCLSSLSDTYAVAAEKFRSPLFLKKKMRRALLFGTAAISLVLMFFPISLRVAAPCEVLPKDPIYITTPVEGRINSIVVEHGERVKQGDLLFSYEKQQPLYELEIKKKEYQIIQGKLEKAEHQSYSKEEALKELQILKFEAEKAAIQKEFVAYQISLMDVKSPEDGMVEVDKPEQWRGKRVAVGEQVMMIYNENSTYVQISIPYADRINFNLELPVKIFLNSMPEKSYLAKLTYISSFTEVNDQHTVVFIAEANWLEDNDLKPGLKGSAILYGEQVPLIYWLMRKPINSLREVIGY